MHTISVALDETPHWKIFFAEMHPQLMWERTRLMMHLRVKLIGKSMTLEQNCGVVVGLPFHTDVRTWPNLAAYNIDATVVVVAAEINFVAVGMAPTDIVVVAAPVHYSHHNFPLATPQKSHIAPHTNEPVDSFADGNAVAVEEANIVVVVAEIVVGGGGGGKCCFGVERVEWWY